MVKVDSKQWVDAWCKSGNRKLSLGRGIWRWRTIRWHLQCMVPEYEISERMWCAIVIWVTLHVVASLLGVKNFHENKMG